MGFWEDLKDAFKTKSQRDEERAEEMRKALEAEKEVTKKFVSVLENAGVYKMNQKGIEGFTRFVDSLSK